MLSKALMWVIKQMAQQDLLPWVITSTNQLVPTLHRFMLQARDLHSDIRSVRWQ